MEVVVVDGGTDPKIQSTYGELFREGKIDKLKVIQPNHTDDSRETCYI